MIRSRTGENAVSDDVWRKLVLRAQTLRRSPTTEEAEGEAVWVAEFPFGRQTCAVFLETVRAVVPIRVVTQVPLAPPQIIGLLRFRGEILTAYSLPALLPTSGWQQDPPVLLVVQTSGGRLIAFDCEQIPKASTLSRAAIDAATKTDGGVCDVLRDGRDVLRLIDIDALLARARRTGGHDGGR
jgi:purine-binding chemotaxis protein CheW